MVGGSFAFSPTPPVAFPGGPLEAAGLHLYRTDFGLQIAFLLGVVNYVLVVRGGGRGGGGGAAPVGGRGRAAGEKRERGTSVKTYPRMSTLFPHTQDAAERGRLGASTFRNLNYGAAASSALISGSTL